MSATVEFALGPIKQFLNPAKWIEIKAVKAGEIALETVEGNWEIRSVPDADIGFWTRLGHALAVPTDQRFDDKMPLIRAKLPGGHRLQMMVGPNVMAPVTDGPGIYCAIRLKSKRKFQFENFGLDADGVRIITEAVKVRKNILVCGGTGSGKTSLTNLVCALIDDPCPISIEDTPELDLPQMLPGRLLISPVAANTDVGFKEILDAIIRWTPHRIIIGELNIDNAFVTMRTLNVGVDGLIGTIHADKARDAIPALAELLALRGYTSGNAAIQFYERKLDLIVHVGRSRDKRLVTEIYSPSQQGGETLWTPA